MTILLASLLAFAPPAQASEEISPYHFDDALRSSGWTLRLDGGANVTVFPGVLTGPADVTWKPSSDALPALPPSTKLLGSYYRLYVSGITALDTSKYQLAVALPDTPGMWSRSVWLYDRTTSAWSKLPSKLNAATKKWQAGVSSLDGYVMVLEDRNTQEGIASWYCKNYCSKRYPVLHGTSNDFPVGSTVTVKNVANGKSVNVKIISRWGQPAGRVVDLSWAAYNKLQATNKGLTKVTVSPYVAAPVTPVQPVVASKTESIPKLTVTAAATAPTPTLSATAYRVVDAATGTVLVEKNAVSRHSIASLTKLMTAVVFLDTQPNMKATFVYNANDGTGKDAAGKPYGYNNLTLRSGDTVQLRDLFYATLVGSANNGASALVRAAGLTRTEFVARMNAKAAAWGMTDTTFVEPSGLDPGNVSTAKDVAIMAAKAFNTYEPIRYVTTRSSYTFYASRSGRHTVKTTDTLLTRNNGITVTGGKTGYINESKYTYVVRVKNAQGAQIVVSLLGSASSATRFTEAASLVSWAWKNFTWS
ncbi:MAG: serine hydrolase [Candidatus Kerfeldbacteria bacterium]|nr:serine hydrolase [Candidatus Kerfeldbacteria bacterium]